MIVGVNVQTKSTKLPVFKLKNDRFIIIIWASIRAILMCLWSFCNILQMNAFIYFSVTLHFDCFVNETMLFHICTPVGLCHIETMDMNRPLKACHFFRCSVPYLIYARYMELIRKKKIEIENCLHGRIEKLWLISSTFQMNNYSFFYRLI